MLKLQIEINFDFDVLCLYVQFYRNPVDQLQLVQNIISTLKVEFHAGSSWLFQTPPL